MCSTDLGFLGNDPPQELFLFVLDFMKRNDGDVDAIIMNGDFISHNLPLGKDTATSQ